VDDLVFCAYHSFEITDKAIDGSRSNGTIGSREVLEHINLARYSAVLAQSSRKPP
jgi:hypothetical protein